MHWFPLCGRAHCLSWRMAADGCPVTPKVLKHGCVNERLDVVFTDLALRND